MSGNLQYGTERNPIRLINDNSPRALFEVCPSLELAILEAVKGIDLGKVRGRDDVDLDMAYVLNLISNPNLDDKTVRLGCLLFSDHQYNFSDVIYDLTNNDEISCLDDVGEDGLICVGTPRNFSCLEMPLSSLSKKLAKHGIQMDRSEILRSMKILHEFYYITSTDICYENSYLSKSTGCVKLSDNTRLVNVHITTSMINKCISGKWPSETINVDDFIS
ncbi:hypothetical protein [Rheinheimera oceanensis]|uniref:hypothetical protein n=1 Tax=Rheinheimera oceanensis TaxID=2817449 RepID=UPI001BFDF243|nr:hypothetical protein [Rheinheimera oceanensis]